MYVQEFLDKMRDCTVWAPKLDLGKIKSKIKFAFLLPTILETVNYLAGK